MLKLRQVTDNTFDTKQILINYSTTKPILQKRQLENSCGSTVSVIIARQKKIEQY